MRVRALGRFLPDLLIIGLGLGCLVDGALSAGLQGPSDLVFTLGWVGALLARRRFPWSPALVPVLIAAQGVALQTWPNGSALTMLALLVSAGVLGVRMPVLRALVAAPLWPAAVGALMLTTEYGEAGLSDLFYPGTFMLAVLGGGLVVGRATSGRRTARTRAAEVERELEAHRAGIVAQERARIAQDLRALVAAGISGIQQRAVRTRALLEQGDAAEAERVLLQIEDAGRETLADLRHMLGLLRRDTTDEGQHPQPGLGALAGVVSRAEQRGTTVELEVEGPSPALSRGVEVVVYRVIERTVEQACRAGVPRLSVRIRHEPAAVSVAVHGRGLGQLVGDDHLAIRERVVLYGGDLLVGTDEQDRDVLQVRLPLPAAAGGMPGEGRSGKRTPAEGAPAEGAPA